MDAIRGVRIGFSGTGAGSARSRSSLDLAFSFISRVRKFRLLLGHMTPPMTARFSYIGLESSTSAGKWRETKRAARAPQKVGQERACYDRSATRKHFLGLSWLSLMRSPSVVAGTSPIGQDTNDRRKWPFQLGRTGSLLSQSEIQWPARQ
jgi:hypothetical protein